jgi:NADH-quinone oxidoreductase subunit C
MTVAILDLMQQQLVPAGGEASLSHGMLVVVVSPTDLLGTVRRLKSEFGFDLFLDVTAVDRAHTALRRRVPLLFHRTQIRVRRRPRSGSGAHGGLGVRCTASAHFMERECHDMYGIVFAAIPTCVRFCSRGLSPPAVQGLPKLQEQPLVPYRT